MDPAKTKDGWTPALYALLFLAGLGVFVLGYLNRQQGFGHLMLAAGLVVLALAAGLWPVAAALRNRAAADAEVSEAMQRLSQSLGLSDAARRVLNRERDRDILRQAIREEVRKGAFGPAIVLVNELSQEHGLREEAEELRDQVLKARAAEFDRKIGASIQNVEGLLARRDWDLAAAEAAKIERLYPDSPRVKDLPARVRNAKEQFKLELERQFLAAKERDDIPQAMDLLKELDKYLSEAEAEPFREIARDVIGKHRQNLGVRFKLAISDKDWISAVRIGEQLIREFPNSKMAQEVRSRLDVLRQNAATQQQAQSAANVPV